MLLLSHTLIQEYRSQDFGCLPQKGRATRTVLTLINHQSGLEYPNQMGCLKDHLILCLALHLGFVLLLLKCSYWLKWDQNRVFNVWFTLQSVHMKVTGHSFCDVLTTLNSCWSQWKLMVLSESQGPSGGNGWYEPIMHIANNGLKISRSHWNKKEGCKEYFQDGQCSCLSLAQTVTFWQKTSDVWRLS